MTPFTQFYSSQLIIIIWKYRQTTIKILKVRWTYTNTHTYTATTNNYYLFKDKVNISIETSFLYTTGVGI